MKRFIKLFCVGGTAYVLLEWLWRGRSHPSMFVIGGTCFHLIGGIGNRLYRKSRCLAALASSLAVTGVEYVSGRFINLRLRLNVWDYRHLPFNLHGQICLLYSVLWGFLSFPTMSLYRHLQKTATS